MLHHASCMPRTTWVEPAAAQQYLRLPPMRQKEVQMTGQRARTGAPQLATRGGGRGVSEVAEEDFCFNQFNQQQHRQ